MVKHGPPLKNTPESLGEVMGVSEAPTDHSVTDGDRAGIGRIFDSVENGLGKLVDIVAAALLLLDIILLGWAVTARYVFNIPVTWVEEVAMLAFLWFGMLGAASAVRRKIHLRLTFVLSHMASSKRAFFERVANVVLLVFLLALIKPTLDLAHLNHIMTSPNLNLPGSVPVLATLVSVLLIIVFLQFQMWRGSSVRGYVTQLVAAVVLSLGLGFTPPLMADLGNMNLLLFFGVAVMGFIVIGVPIAFSFGIATVGYFTLTTNMPLTVIVGRINEGMSHFILLTIPLFIFLGIQIQYTGMARAMINFVVALIGSARGGLSYVMLCAMYLVSGISGAKAADMAAIGPIIAPAMKERGTKEGDIAALLAVSAAAAETIPPSLVLIIIGSVTGISIAALFIGGLIPAVVCMLALAVAVYFRSRNERHEKTNRDFKLIGKTFLIAIPALTLPLIIRVAVLEGVATATEVAVIGIIYTAIVGTIMMRGISLPRMGQILVETVALTGTIMIIVALAGAMSWALTQSGFADKLVALMTGLPGGKFTFLAVSIVAFIVFGSVLEGIPAIVLFGPLLVPVAQSLGVHPVQYSMVVLLSMGLGLFSPPFGYGYYTACAIAKVSPDDAMWNMLPYLFALLVAIILIAVFPWFSIGFL